MYQALYRKWRPRTFDDVVGQQHITDTLKKQVETGRFSHAYLFVGTRGTGKTTCAKILARAVNCQHPVNGNPCNECEACRGIEDGSILDVVELDAASNNGVDSVRALREEAVYTPNSVKTRVYIIDEVHMLSNAAFNALLKILEEPPEHLVFILCTTELRKVLPTIVSRCQRHNFKRLSTKDISGRLMYVAQQEGLNLEQDAADLLARLADGGMRDGLSLLDQCSAKEHIDMQAVLDSMGLVDSLKTAELLEDICQHNAENSLKHFNELWYDGKEPLSILNGLASLIRDVLLLQVIPKNGESLVSGNYMTDTLKNFKNRLSTEELIDKLNLLEAVNKYGDPRRAAEICLISLCAENRSLDINGINSRLAALENKLQNGVAVSLSAPPAVPLNVSAEEPRTETVKEKPGDSNRMEPPPKMEIPTQEPVKEKTDEVSRKSDSGKSMGDWPSFLSHIGSSIDPFIYAFLSDETTNGEVSGDTLIIHMDEAYKSMMDSDSQKKIKLEASGYFGRMMNVSFQSGTEEARVPNREKILGLENFSNFRIE